MKGFKKKHILSAFLLALALAVASFGNVTSIAATKSSGGAASAYASINQYTIPSVSSGYMTAEEALQWIYQRYTAEQLQEYIEYEPAIAAILEQLRIMAGIEKAEKVVSPEVEERIPSITVTGAEFNAADGETVTLNVTVPENGASVNVENMINVVQLDINLSGVKDSHNLEYPVYITISIPAGFSADNGIKVLHYVNGIENTPVEVPSTVSGGTITFTTDSFSVFAIVEVGEDEDVPPEDEPEEQPADQPVKDSVPKTGDSTVPVLPFAAAGVVFAAAAYGLKKRGQE